MTPNPLPAVLEIIMFLIVATSDSSRANFDWRWMFSSAFLLMTTDAGIEVILPPMMLPAEVVLEGMEEIDVDGGDDGRGTIIFCSAFVGHSVEMPESRSSDDPSPSSQGEDDRICGSCFMFCRASKAVAASLSPRCDLCRNFSGRVLL